MPVADGGSAGTPKPPKSRKPPKRVTPSPAPVVSNSSEPTPNRATYGPSQAPSSPVSPRPDYVRATTSRSDIASQQGPSQPAQPRTTVSDTLRQIRDRTPDSAFRVTRPPITEGLPERSKNTNDIGDYLRGIRSGGRNLDAQLGIGGGGTFPDENATTSLLDDLDSNYRNDVTVTDQPSVFGPSDSLARFIERIRPKNFTEDALGFNESYRGVALPERLMHKGGRLNAPLESHWDQEQFLKSVYAGGFTGDTSFDVSQRKQIMNDFLYKQMLDQQDWIERKTINKALRAKETLETATEELHEGEFGTVAEMLEKNPDLFTIPAYKDNFSTTADEVWGEWFTDASKYKDEYVRTAFHEAATFKRKHYENAAKAHRDARSIVEDAIAKYEDEYQDAVEFHKVDPDKVGPAIPEVKHDDRKELDDIVAKRDGKAELAEFIKTGAGKKVIRAQRQEAMKELKVKDLPTVKEMLTVLVANKMIDPDNKEQVKQWIDRLRNPNHPDTRGMYVAFAKEANKDLDLKKAEKWVNEPITEYVKDTNKRAKRNAKHEADQKKKELEKDDLANFELYAGSWSGTTAMSPSDTKKMHENAMEDGGLDHSALMWTVDKLMRFNYAVAGTAGGVYDLDKDPKGASKWSTGLAIAQKFNPQGFALDPLAPLTGKSWLDSADDVIANPESLKHPVSEGYSQFFRGSNLPGVKKDITPVTFSAIT